jgi:antirestriction protein ArdC/AraC-like DNA-binding protein
MTAPAIDTSNATARNSRRSTGSKQPPRRDIYQEVTDRIVAALEQGVAPWAPAFTIERPGYPRNGATGRAYHGVNVLLLWLTAMERGYLTHEWFTFNQACEAVGLKRDERGRWIPEVGKGVRRGEKGTLVTFWKLLELKGKGTDNSAPTDEEAKRVPLLRHFYVWNRAQIDGLPTATETSEVRTPAERIESAEEIARRALVSVTEDAAIPYYDPATDSVHMVPLNAYHTPEAYYVDLLHELTHWTGHPSRLNREMGPSHRSPEYAREELVAEMGSAFLCASIGIQGKLQHPEYIHSWLTRLREDNRAIFRAASQARQAADFLLGPENDPDDGEESEPSGETGGEGQAPLRLISGAARHARAGTYAPTRPDRRARAVNEGARASIYGGCLRGTCDRTERFRIATLLTTREREQVDAGAVECVRTRHRESLADVRADLGAGLVDGVLVSASKIGAEMVPVIRGLVNGFPSQIVVGLVGDVPEAVAVTASVLFGQSGIRSVVDVRSAEGWRELRNIFDCGNQPDAFIRQALAVVLYDIGETGPEASDGRNEFFRLTFSPRVTTAKEVARRLGVHPSTLMSRFFRAELPSPKQYVAYARLVWAAYLAESPGMSVAAIANRLNASSPQSFHRTVRSITGRSATEFRHAFTGAQMLECFRSRLVLPYREKLQSFDPLADSSAGGIAGVSSRSVRIFDDMKQGRAA